ncbi:MAG: gpW family protein [Marinobacterium sp.]|nr:gpW family protein [Marinobacterium sp.]
MTTILQQQLDEARQALHQLNIGQGVVSIQRDGRKVDFRPADRSQLQSYIGELEAKLNPRGAGRRAFRVG